MKKLKQTIILILFLNAVYVLMIISIAPSIDLSKVLNTFIYVETGILTASFSILYIIHPFFTWLKEN